MDNSIDKVNALSSDSQQVKILKKAHYWDCTAPKEIDISRGRCRIGAIFDSNSDALSAAIIVGWDRHNIRAIGEKKNNFFLSHDFADENEAEKFCKAIKKHGIDVNSIPRIEAESSSVPIFGRC